jgi:predicted transcriptional regulator
MLEQQRAGRPVHEWPLAQPAKPASAAELTVADIMTSDLFTLGPDDVVDLAAGVMEWKRIRHIPVEDAGGRLIGMLTARDLIASTGAAPAGGEAATAVRSLMRRDFSVVAPDLDVIGAVPVMLASDLGALLVVSHEKLLGIVTERDLMQALARLLADKG